MCNLTTKEIEQFLMKDLPNEKYQEVKKILSNNSDCLKKAKKIQKRLKRNEAKRKMLPHSKAKVDMYSAYLGRYLSILTRARFVEKINIIDMFCGRGFYDNDEEGSPIKAFKIIRKVQAKLITQKKELKQVKLIINDKNPIYVDTIKDYINEENKPEVFNLYPEYYNLDVEELFPKIINILENQSRKEKNLIFIDPYGYKNIHKNALQRILENDATEVILFLPISQMHRFKQVAVKDEENSSYDKLREFINEFFEKKHPISQGEKVSSTKFIHYIEKALSFNDKYFSTSFYIERDNKKNVYSLFFITPSIKGWEKILESKWEMDKEEGRSFRLSFSGSFFETAYTNIYEDKLKKFISTQPRTNLEIYTFGLKNNHLPKHSNEILKKWKISNRLEIIDFETKKPNNRGLYTSSKEIKVLIKYIT